VMSKNQCSNEYLASVAWHADDIRTLRPDWDDERCNAFLEDNGDYIQDAMIERGWEAIESLLAVQKAMDTFWEEDE
jgi:hypothetical protein